MSREIERRVTRANRAKRCLQTLALYPSETRICCQQDNLLPAQKKITSIFTRRSKRNEGADASHEGVADHLQRSISSNMFILRRYARSGAVDMREMVFFVICSLPRFSRGESKGRQGLQRVLMLVVTGPTATSDGQHLPTYLF